MALIAAISIAVLMADRGRPAADRIGAPTSLTDAVTTWFLGDRFMCTSSAVFGTGPAPPVAHVKAVGAAKHSKYDRVTMQFAEGQPAQIELQIHSGAGFTEVPGGRPVVLEGEYGALLTLHAADGHASFNGPSDLKTSYPVVLELRRVQDFGGTVQWAIGLSQAACFRVGFLVDPAGLVIDFQLRRLAQPLPSQRR